MQYPLRREWSRGRGIAPGTRHTRQGAMTAAELFDLKGRVALVTGASSGLGVRFAELLAGGGAPGALVARRADRLPALKARIDEAGGPAVALAPDVTHRRATMRAFQEAQ